MHMEPQARKLQQAGTQPTLLVEELYAPRFFQSPNLLMSSNISDSRDNHNPWTVNIGQPEFIKSMKSGPSRNLVATMGMIGSKKGSERIIHKDTGRTHINSTESERMNTDPDQSFDNFDIRNFEWKGSRTQGGKFKKTDSLGVDDDETANKFMNPSFEFLDQLQEIDEEIDQAQEIDQVPEGNEEIDQAQEIDQVPEGNEEIDQVPEWIDISPCKYKVESQIYINAPPIERPECASPQPTIFPKGNRRTPWNPNFKPDDAR
jgi:hypothetical protein